MKIVLLTVPSSNDFIFLTVSAASMAGEATSFKWSPSFTFLLKFYYMNL